MLKLNDCEFVLLGCATSNLGTDAYPFVVVICEIELNDCTLKSYVLKGWQDVREFFPDEVREDVLLFLDSLGDYSLGQEAERFFVQLHNLSVGPIRFIAGKTCGLHVLDEAISAILEGGKDRVLWPESFKLVQHNKN